MQKFEERYFFKYFGFDFDDEGWLSFDKKSIRYRFKRIYPKKYTFGANKNLTGLKTYLRTEVLIDNHYNPLNPEKLVSFIKVHPFKEP